MPLLLERRAALLDLDLGTGELPESALDSADSSIADPWIEHAVQDVDPEVHEHVDDRDDRDEVLQRDVLAPVDRVVDRVPDAR